METRKVFMVPIYGIGQGNGAGPAIWAVISTPLLNMLRNKGYGCKFIFPLSSKYVQFVGYAFVDDTDILQSSLNNCPTTALQMLQQAIDTWEQSSKATYRAVVPKKTVWWLVSFIWEGNSWRYASLQDSSGDLLLNDITGTRKTIKRLAANQAHETLGAFLAPDGNLEAQFLKMKKMWQLHGQMLCAQDRPALGHRIIN
jgi:hypothetical protein